MASIVEKFNNLVEQGSLYQAANLVEEYNVTTDLDLYVIVSGIMSGMSFMDLINLED